MSTTDRHARTRHWFDWVQTRRGWVYALALVWGLAGVFCFRALRRDLFPDMTLPSLQILIQSPGRSPTELEMTVAQPVERALSGLPGVRRIVSTVQNGVTQIVVAFESGVDPWRSRQMVTEKLTLAAAEFPAGTAAPLLTSASGRLQEIQELVVAGDEIDPMKLRDHALKVLVPYMQSIPGVARVEVLGGQDRQLQILVDPARMRAAGVGLDAVLEALEGAERDSGAGLLETGDKQWAVSVASAAVSPEALRRLPVRAGSSMLTLGEVAEVRVGPGFRQGLATWNGREVVALRVIKQPQAEAFATARRVREKLPDLRQGLPAGMRLELVYDQGRFIGHALGGVMQALLVGGLFVALVLIALLGDLRSALIVILLLPLATLGAAVPLLWLGQSLNAMTLGGLAIAVGLLVDAGVIMVENLVHHLHLHGGKSEGADRRSILSRAAAEIGGPILTAVLVILAVFIPLLMVGGVAGRLYAPLALAIGSAMTLSLIFSFTLVPALVDRLLPPGTTLDEPRLVSAIKRAYRPALRWALRNGVKVQIIAAAAAIPAFILAFRLGSDFLPKLDEGALILNSNLPSDSSMAAVQDGNQVLEAELAKVDGTAGVYLRTGRGELTEDPMPHYSSDLLVIRDDKRSPGAFERDLAAAGERMPFAVELTTPMGMKVAEGIGGTPADIQVKFFNPDLNALTAALPEIGHRLASLPGVASVAPDTGAPLTQMTVVPDEEALRRQGVPRRLLLEAVRASLQGLPLEPWYDGSQAVDRIVRFAGADHPAAEDLLRVPLVIEGGRVVELGQVAKVVEVQAPSMIRHENGQRRLALNIRAAGDLGGTGARVESALKSLALPPGTTTDLGGRIEEARETRRRLLLAIGAAGTLIVLLLYLTLGHWWEVGVVLATLPDAFVGGLIALALAGETWNVSSIVGVIGLFGVAVQNSLVLISQVKALRAEGLPFAAALEEASLGRVRPKLMTAGCAILGLAPMLFGFGGSELERPLAVVMVGGLVTSTLFTLLVLPSFYAWIAGMVRKPAPEEIIGA